MAASFQKQLKAIGLLTALFAANTVLAQVTPGQVTDTLKKPVELKQPEATPQVQRENAAPAPVAAGGPTLEISQFQFSGNTLFSSAELSALLTSYLNHPVTLADIYASADTVGDYYVSKGYSLASVSVPPQKISSGKVLLQISEGVIGKISFEGAKRQKPQVLRQYLGNVKSGSVYHGTELEQGLRTINELPGVTARAVLKPGEAEGTSDLVIKTEEKTFAGNLAVDNYGTKDIGKVRYSAGFTVNNALGMEDQLSLLGLVSSGSRLKYGFLGYSLPVSATGTRLAVSYGQADFETALSEGSSKSGKIEAQQPVVRGQRDQLDVSAGVSRSDSDAFLSGGGGIPLSGTSITLVELGATYNHSYANSAVTQLTSSLATNFNRAATVAEARPAAKADNAPQRLRLELDAQHLQPLNAGFFALLHLDGVYSPDPLSNATQFSLGGPQNVRGYPTSEVRGDRGYFGSLTFARNFELGPTKLTPRVFVDSGRVLCAAIAPDCKAQSRSSGGAGADFSFSGVVAKVDYSHTIGGFTVSDGHDSGRVFASLSAGF